MTVEKFVEKIKGMVNAGPEEIKKGIRDDNEYPVGAKFEEHATIALEKMVAVNRHMDEAAEEKPLSLMEYMEEYAHEVEKLNVSRNEMRVAKKMFETLKNLYNEKLDSDKVIASAIEDLGEGVFILKYNRILIDDKTVAPGEKVNDIAENKPVYAVFVDVTPGEAGLHTYITGIENVKKG